jgi:membrane-associated protein
MYTFWIILRFIFLPLVLLIIFGLFIAFYRLLNLPSSQELIQIAKDYYSQYGYFVVFLAALAEGFLVINWYLPGSFVIVLGVSFSQGDPFKATGLVGLVILGFSLMYVLNYAIGCYGWYRFLIFLGLGSQLENMKRRVERYGLPIIFSTYFHPNIGALTATSAGILKLPFVRFLTYSILATISWNALWGLIVYFAGETMLNLLSIKIVFLLLLLWLMVAIVRAFRYSRRNKPS